jgi:hypothetical protein
MTTRFIKAVTLLACAVFSTLALAQDVPARVGRVSLAQGQVSISGEVGDEATAALVNWPVTSHNQITTGRGARTEIRIGSTSVRLDADSSLEVAELDDDSLRLRLNYGSASVRVRNPEVLAGFELETPNGRVRLQEPGRLRVDAERERGTSVVNVFDGVALVDDRGSQLIVRAGKRAELRDDDVRTGAVLRTGFDDWSQQRDAYDDRSTSARYVTSEMTGYEDLDQNGVWRDDPEYGPLWLPTVVAPGWAPYRDGSWTWVSPWGWTWVDNAPWGYAPFHYGRWVQVNQRWAWAPGRQVGRPVWAPALVGWVGGGGWNLSFGAGGHRPAQGWYPLSPRDAFVPGYRLSQQHLQHLNRDSRHDRDDRRGDRRDDRRHDERNDHRRDGLTVVPQEQFGHRGTVGVRNAPHAAVTPQALQAAPSMAPAAPQGAGRGERFERRQPREQQAAPAVISAPGVMTAPAPSARRDGERERSGRPLGVMPPSPSPMPMPQPMMPRPAAPLPMPQPMMPPSAAPLPMPQPIVPPPAAVEQRGRAWRNEGERRMREPEVQQPRQPAAAAPMQQMIQQAQQHAAQQAQQQAAQQAAQQAQQAAQQAQQVAQQAQQQARQQAAQQQARAQAAPAASASGEQRPQRQGGNHKNREEQER